MKLIVIVILAVLCYGGTGDAYRILGVFNMCTYSHYTLGIRLMKELADRGHDVTFITAYKQKQPTKNLREIWVSESCEGFKVLKANLYGMGRMSYLGQLEYVHSIGMITTEVTFKNKEVQKLLASDEKFDLVLVEQFADEAFAIFAHKFNCPLVWMAPGPTTIFNNHLMGNPSPSSYVPNLLSNFGSKMNFWERMSNAWMDIVGSLYVQLRTIPGQNALLQKYLPGSPQLTDILYKGSFMLISSHVSISDPVPLQQNIKEIGGYHVGPIKPIPDDLKKFLDSATEGAIIFSMGSNLKSADFAEDKKRAVLKVFSKIKQKVLWKFETDLPGKPANVRIVSWLPQQDVLGHPNVVAFITHGGLLGLTEAVYHGVPLLGLPVYWDQAKNVEDAARKGFAVTLKYEHITEERFQKALSEILNNPKYKENARMRSRVMHGQPMKQLDEAVFWIEYVIKHNGATFLRSPGVDLTWYQRYMVDVVAFIVSLIVAVIALIKYISKKVTSSSKHKNVGHHKKRQ